MAVSRRIFLAGLGTTLAGCGSAPTRTELMAPDRLDPASYRAPGIPARFGDTRPHGWTGTAPADLPVHGLDAARYQGVIDWNEAARSGVRFAWLKATEGGDHVDPGWGHNARAARTAGVPVGAYHFFYFCTPAAEQARWFIKRVKRHRGDLPPVLDIEWNHTSPTCQRRPPAAHVRDEMRVFLRALTKHYGTRPVIYTTIDFWRDNGLEGFTGYDLWLRSVAGHPGTRYPGARWTFWQYSGTGVVPGVPGTVDMNAFHGSEVAWKNWLATRRQ